jgi:hypothetical protein
MSIDVKPGSNVRSCARCQHGVLIRCAARQRSAPCTDNFSFPEQPVRLALTYGFDAKGPNLELASGELYAMVCRACGFVEWYADHPEQIPIGAKYGTELVGATSSGPYR